MLTLNGGIQIPFLVSKTTTQEFKPSHRVKKESEWEEKEMKEKHHTLFFFVCIGRTYTDIDMPCCGRDGKARCRAE